MIITRTSCSSAMLLAGCALTLGCSQTAAPPISSTAAISIVECSEFGVLRTVGIPIDAALRDDLLSYLSSEELTEGSSTWASYVPALLIETDAIQVNFHEKRVVVSTRASKGSVWRPVVRRKSDSDAAIESKVREYLRGVPAGDEDR